MRGLLLMLCLLFGLWGGAVLAINQARQSLPMLAEQLHRSIP